MGIKTGGDAVYLCTRFDDLINSGKITKPLKAFGFNATDERDSKKQALEQNDPAKKLEDLYKELDLPMRRVGTEGDKWAGHIDPLLLFVKLTERLESLGGLSTEWIFRSPGDDTVVNDLLVRVIAADGFDEIDEILIECEEPKDAASLLSRWIRKQDDMVPQSKYESWETLSELAGDDEFEDAAEEAAETCVVGLPQPGQSLLRGLIKFLQKIDAGPTKMTPANLGMVFGPTVVPRPDAEPMELLQHVKADAAFVTALIENLQPPQPEPEPEPQPQPQPQPEPEPEPAAVDETFTLEVDELERLELEMMEIQQSDSDSDNDIDDDDEDSNGGGVEEGSPDLRGVDDSLLQGLNDL